MGIQLAAFGGASSTFSHFFAHSISIEQLRREFASSSSLNSDSYLFPSSHFYTPSHFSTSFSNPNNNSSLLSSPFPLPNPNNNQLQGAFPHYQQLFFCSGGLNIEGRSVDACVESGKACDGGAAAAGFCRHLGFDGAVPDQVAISEPDGIKNVGTPARSVTGEWCTGSGYDSTLGALDREGFEKLAAVYGKQPARPCSVLERVACYRSRESLSESWKAAGDKARAVAVEQSLPGPSVAPRARSGAVGSGSGAGGAAANSPAPAPRAADASVFSAATSDASLTEDSAAAKTASASVGGRRPLLSA